MLINVPITNPVQAITFSYFFLITLLERYCKPKVLLNQVLDWKVFQGENSH